MTKKLCPVLAAALVIMLGIAFAPCPSNAEQLAPFSEKRCSDFNSPKAFVKKAVLACLQSRESRKCERSAESFFNECGYDGEYREMSAKVRSDILMLIVLQGTPSLKSPGERKKL